VKTASATCLSGHFGGQPRFCAKYSSGSRMVHSASERSEGYAVRAWRLRVLGYLDARILLRRRLEAPESYFAKLPLRRESDDGGGDSIGSVEVRQMTCIRDDLEVSVRHPGRHVAAA
jgi:hypothetical protein